MYIIFFRDAIKPHFSAVFFYFTLFFPRNALIPSVQGASVYFEFSTTSSIGFRRFQRRPNPITNVRNITGYVRAKSYELRQNRKSAGIEQHYRRLDNSLIKA